jgi:hypothetical protein
MAEQGDIYGRGTAFPPRIGADGRLAYSAGAENVRECIRVILLTEPGERIMRPGFGGGLKRFLFQPNTAATHRLIEETIRGALGRWEPRIELLSVEVVADPDDPDAALATLQYRLVAGGDEELLGLRVALAGGPAGGGGT